MSKVSSADDKRLRREIANSNERRRMQSINAGFIALRQLLPLNEGEKLSKAAILQLTAKYINVLSQEKSRLLQQNNKLKELLQQQASSSCTYAPPGRSSGSTSVSVVDEGNSSGDGQRPVLKEPRSTVGFGIGVGSVAVSIADREAPVTNVAHEVTVGSELSSLSIKNEHQLAAQTATATSTSLPTAAAVTTATATMTARVADLPDAAQMNLPLRKRKRTFSLSVEPTGAPIVGSSMQPVDSLLSTNGCRQADAVACIDDGGDTDADGNSAAASSTCRTLPRDVTPSTATSDAEGVAMSIDRFRFVPSAPLPTGTYSAVFDAGMNDADCSPLGVYPTLANSVMLGPAAATYGSAMLVSANAPASAAQQRSAVFTSPPFRFDMITSMQPAAGVPLVLSTASCRQRLDNVQFANTSQEPTSYQSVVSPPASGVRQCESSTSITKKNLETIFEAIRHVEGDDLSLGESPCKQDAVESTPAAAPIMFTANASSDASQQPAAFFVCLSPANLALSPTHTASIDFSKQHQHQQSSLALAPSTAVQFSMNAAINSVISPVGVTNASRFTSRAAQPQFVVATTAPTGAEFESSSGVSVSLRTGGIRAGQNVSFGSLS